MMRALVVEDDKAQQQIYHYILNAAGFQIASAYNGQEAIQYLETHELPHLLILDMKMPQSNGLDVLRHLETYPQLDDVRIVIATAAVAHEQEYIQYQKKFPSVDYLMKPRLLPELQAILKKYFGSQIG
jgi:CheY-like chemotaxis protein